MGAGIPREMCWRESRTSDRRGWQCTSSSSRGSFLERYNNSRCAACESALDDCPVAEALHQMALGGVLDGSCEATASALLRTPCQLQRSEHSENRAVAQDAASAFLHAAPHRTSAPPDRHQDQLRPKRQSPHHQHLAETVGTDANCAPNRCGPSADVSQDREPETHPGTRVPPGVRRESLFCNNKAQNAQKRSRMRFRAACSSELNSCR